jgi:beta-glucosidase
MRAPRRSSSAPQLSRRHLLGLGGAALASASAPSGAPAATKAAGFPKGFLWGTATAAYQIEGGAEADGRGKSVWDVFSRKPGAVFEGHTGDVACDHYHRWREDLGLISQLGANAYRFSVGWPRVLPGGVGQVNQAGLDFYDRLVDALLAARVTPMCTLFHWDFPQALYERKGWLNRDSAAWFAEYTDVVARRLSDRVKLWVTQNEPQVFMGLGHLQGTHAPGDKLPLRDFLLASHNSLRAHGRGVQALRAAARGPLSVGYVVATTPGEPASDRPEDLEAARAGQWQVAVKDSWSQSWWLDPIFAGRYPEDGMALFGADAPRPAAGDFEEIKQPLDFLGLNIYTSNVWRRGADGKPESVKTPVGYPRSTVDWQPLRPAALYWGPRHFHERYKLPLYITESGLATRDQVFLDGKVHDPHRVDYLHRALLELERACREGLDVRGYFLWSLLDNYEWADGYKQRFGLVYVDFPTGKRLPKDSYHWYRRVIASGGRSLLQKTALPPALMTPL